MSPLLVCLPLNVCRYLARSVHGKKVKRQMRETPAMSNVEWFKHSYMRKCSGFVCLWAKPQTHERKMSSKSVAVMKIQHHGRADGPSSSWNWLNILSFILSCPSLKCPFFDFTWILLASKTEERVVKEGILLTLMFRTPLQNPAIASSDIGHGA